MNNCKKNELHCESFSESNDQEPSSVVLLLLAAIIGLVPMVVYLRIVPYEGITLSLFNKDYNTDFFTWYKMVWIYLLTSSAFAWFVINRGLREAVYYRSIVLYAAMAILSTVFAIHRDLALSGDPERHEGLFVHLCYMLIVFLFVNIIKTVSSTKFVLKLFLISAFILAVAGALQFFGYDFFFSSFGTKLLISQHLRETMPEYTLESIKKPFEMIFLTFGNGNFAGIYMAMLFPFVFAMLFGITGWKRIPLLCLNLALYINLLGCKSRAALLASIIGGLFAVVLFRKNIIKAPRLAIFLLFSFALIPFVMDAYSMRHGMPPFLNTSIGRPVMRSTASFGVFNDLVIEKNSVKTVFDGVEMKIKFSQGVIEFYDQSGVRVPYRLLQNSFGSASGTTVMHGMSSSAHKQIIEKLNETKLTLGEEQIREVEQVQVSTSLSIKTASASFATPDELALRESQLVEFTENKLRGFIICVWPDKSLLRIGRGGVNFFLAYTTDGFKLVSPGGRACVFKDVESWGFKGRENFGSGRGYIWSRTLPLLKKTLLIGFGPDTFIAHFPNYDHLGKLRFWGSGLNLLIEKPHCLYLQIAVNIGVIALLAILVFWGGYLLQSARLYFFVELNGFLIVSGAAIFVSVISYLVNGIFNDSMVGTSPVFWGLLGMGLAINRMIVAGLATKNIEIDKADSVSVSILQDS